MQLHHGGDVGVEPALTNHHPLGSACGARGVDDVCQAVGRGKVYRRWFVGHGPLAAHLVHQLAVDDHLWPGILQHELSALLRILRVDGQVGGTCLEDSDDGEGEVDGAGEHHGYEVIGTDATDRQPVCQHVGAVRQLAIGEADVVVGHCHAVGAFACTLLESHDEGRHRPDV